MSPQWDTALVGFMHNLGFSDFNRGAAHAPNVSNVMIGDGRCILDIEEIGDGNGIILALFKKVPMHELYDKTRRLLDACSYDKFSPIVVQTGLRGDDTLVLMTRIEQAWAENLSRAFDLMYGLYTQIDG